jgi:hypothetical protein
VKRAYDRHDMSRTREYRAWINMKTRCENPSTPYYKNYGGRGIHVCEEWAKSFMAFYVHVGPRPTSRHTVERIDNTGHYEPGNVKWALRSENLRNKRNNLLVSYRGRTMCVTDAARLAGVPLNTARYRVRNGLPCKGIKQIKEATRGKR